MNLHKVQTGSKRLSIETTPTECATLDPMLCTGGQIDTQLYHILTYTLQPIIPASELDYTCK